jgi:hypothetical protein
MQQAFTVMLSKSAVLNDGHSASGLQPWEAPVMIAEKRKFFFSFLSFWPFGCCFKPGFKP